ncbi:type II toxin-antitoxin system VapC family toxin [Wenzhouxiangella sp. XN201]|uniref:PIN domain-containing protein n=1 Tax=Wenzhouxiangella sp. XN201 TaxID=2710755 RepID=UPI0013CC3B9F|nr:type II toxin-antitoxin system VapC family toxin [Wenzhouxiangella sp. XN201]
MSQYLLDTNILIAAIKGREPVRKRLERIDAPNILISPIVLGELLTGVEKSQRRTSNRQRLLGVLEGFRLIEMAPDVAIRYGELRATLETRGTPIGANDLWIAAQALALGVTLVTDNEREFRRVDDLAVENWLAE